MKLTINGKPRTIKAHPMKRLLDVLREDCGLTGTKEGCGEGECGACTVLIDGVAVDSCLVPVAHAEGCRVITIEGATATRTGKALQKRSWSRRRAVRHLHAGHDPRGHAAEERRIRCDEIQTALAGNLCRCTGYPAIFRSVEAVLKTASQKGEPCRPPLARCRSCGRAR